MAMKRMIMHGTDADLCRKAPYFNHVSLSSYVTEIFWRGSKPSNTFRVAIDLAMGKAFKSHIVRVT